MRFSRAGTLPLVFLPFSHSGRIPLPHAVEPHGFQRLVTERIQREVWAAILGAKGPRIQERVCRIQPLFSLGG
jgi:hypothetical protein